jgi:hypothetical protein
MLVNFMAVWYIFWPFGKFCGNLGKIGYDVPSGNPESVQDWNKDFFQYAEPDAMKPSVEFT